MVKAIIFDMDGVLVDSMPMHLKVWEDLFKENNIPFSIEIFNKYNGTSSKDIARKIVEQYDLDKKPEDIYNEKFRRERILRDDILKLFPHSLSTIDMLKKKGIKIAIATGALPHTVEYVKKRFDLFSHVDALAQMDEVKNGKPAPDLFLLAAKKIGVEPEECAVVEDAVNGCKAANEAGMKSVAITTTAQRESFDRIADFIIDDLDEIEELIGDM